MQLDKKKQIYLMVGIIGFLLIGVAIFYFGFMTNSSKTATNSSGTTAPAPTDTTSTPPLPEGSAPTGAPGAAAMAPTAPGGAPTMIAGGPGMPTAAGGSAQPNAIGKFVDPFKGGLGRELPPKPKGNKHKMIRPMAPPVDTTPRIPVYMVPAVSNQTGTSTPAKNNDVNFFGEIPNQPMQTAKSPVLGRGSGWIASDGQSNITAYFQKRDGTYQTVRVGSYVDGWLVKAIDREYMTIVDESTGREMRVKLIGGDWPGK